MTIDEISKQTGFSRATVARALSNSGYCSQEKKDIILRVAQEGGYQPNYSAKCLRNGQTNRVLVCVPNFSNSFYFELLRGLQEEFSKEGRYLIIFDSKEQVDRELESVKMLQQKYCDGLVMISLDFNETNIGAIRKANRPVVLTNRYPDLNENDNFDYVYLDHERAMFMATEHLIEKGCKRIAMFIGDIGMQTARERAEGYFAALKAHNIPLDNSLVINADFREKTAGTKFEELVNAKIPFDGLITASDLMGRGVYKACERLGIEIGKDFKMVSLDNTDFVAIASPKITSIDMRQYEIGKAAALLLLDRFKGRTTSRTEDIEPRLIVRESSL